MIRGKWCCGTRNGYRQQTTLTAGDLGPHFCEWIGNPCHWPDRQRLIAGEGGGDRLASNDAHEQARKELERTDRVHAELMAQQVALQAELANGQAAMTWAAVLAAEL